MCDCVSNTAVTFFAFDRLMSFIRVPADGVHVSLIWIAVFLIVFVHLTVVHRFPLHAVYV